MVFHFLDYCLEIIKIKFMTMANTFYKVLILGAPASGKGTISSRILKNFQLAYISSGDKLRSHIKANTELGIKAKTYMDVGKLVPDDFMVKFIVSEINKLKGNSWLLDGFPRTVKQAKELQNVQSINLVVNLCVPFDVIINRVKGRWVHLPSGRVYNNEFNAPKVPGEDDLTGENLIQREDDKPDVVRKRLEEYEKLTKPVVQFYKEMGVLEEFYGKTSDEIWPGVLNCLNAHNVPKISV